MGAVGGFIGPYLLGILTDRADGGFTPAFATLAAFLAASGTGILCFPAPGHTPDWSTAASGSLKLGSSSGSGGSGGSSDAEAGGSGGERHARLDAREALKARSLSQQALREVELESDPMLPPAGARSTPA